MRLKKILYIDNISPVGHIVFNRIQINALLDLGYEVYYAFKNDYDKDIAIKNIRKFIEIPIFLYYNKHSKITHRILGFFQLLLIFLKSLFFKFDAVVISSYDPIPLFFFPFRGRVFLFNHNNIIRLSNPVYRWFTKHLPKRYTHLVFNDHMREGLEQYGIKNIQQQQHEPVEPFTVKITDIKPCFNISRNASFLFSPSATSVDSDFIQDIIYDQDFISFLANHNLTLVLKGKYQMAKPSPHVIIIDRYLNEQEYESLFLSADIIFLPYKKSFKYRVSGILFSVFVNNKKVVISDVDGIRTYQDRFNYNPFFENKEHLKEQIMTVFNLPTTLKLYNFNLSTAKERWEILLK